MNEAQQRRSVTRTFSLMNLLTFTALIAIGTAVGLAYRKNRSMLQQRDDLRSLSSRLLVDDQKELVSSEMPRVASDFHSWNVHVPSGKDYELRLGMGAVSEKDIPPIAGSVRIPAGKHRVTLHTGDSPSEAFRYVVYLDGKLAIEKTMGSDWMPGGWSSASGISWPRAETDMPAPLQLSARSYQPKFDFGKGNYFNGQRDEYVTRQGYRLWIDQTDRTYPKGSPFMGFANDPEYRGIGLRDGLRYKASNRPPFDWTFTRPSLNTNDPAIRISAAFFTSEGRTLSSQTPSFQYWQLRGDANGEGGLNWQDDPAKAVYTAFLQAKLKSGDAPQPVMELKWDAARPDEVALRMADAPANDQVIRWRLSILDGSQHLWRELQIGDRTVHADMEVDRDATDLSDGMNTLNFEASSTANTRINWQTNETLPLQVLERRQKPYAGMGLYDGLPLTFGIQIPSTLKPTLAVKIVEEHPTVPATTFPGGNVFDEIQVDLDAARHDWIWLKATQKD